MKLFLHMTDDNVSYANMDGNIVRTTLDDLPEGFSSCYMLGSKDNMTVLPALHSFYTDKDASFKFFLGATRNLDISSDAVLMQLTMMSPTVALPFHWLEVSQEVLDTILLLNAPEIESYSTNHPLRPFTDFAGIHFDEDLVSVLAEIVDPRWFLNGRNNYLNRLDSYFGINCPMTHKRQQRLQLLQRVYQKTSKDRLNLSKKGLERLLHYLMRSWLTKLNRNYKIDPNKFFSDKAVVERFYASFGE